MLARVQVQGRCGYVMRMRWVGPVNHTWGREGCGLCGAFDLVSGE